MAHKKPPHEDEQLNWQEIYMKYQEDAFDIDFDTEPVSKEELNQLWRDEYIR